MIAPMFRNNENGSSSRQDALDTDDADDTDFLWNFRVNPSNPRDPCPENLDVKCEGRGARNQINLGNLNSYTPHRERIHGITSHGVRYHVQHSLSI